MNLTADPQPAGDGGPLSSKYPNLSFCSQNLRSLNISTKNNITKEKIFAITKEKTDIIFICDLKLNSDVQKAAVHDVEKYFMLNGYKLYHNSTKSTRGVGILISRKLAHSIVNAHKDPDCNILLLDVEIQSQKVKIGLIYGPNNNDPIFFTNLENFLRGLNNGTTILGGDFNTTWDDRHVDVNLDTHAMQNVPSLFHTNKLRELCTTFELVDPYRALCPNKKDFTYVPSAVDNLNRSRIDMFLINVRLLPHVKNCLISPGLLTAHFDHKCISLNFKSKIGIKNYPVKNCILKEDEVNWQVNSSVLETYIQHAIVDVNYTDAQKDHHLLTIGRINTKIQESLSLKLQLANVGTDNFLELQIAAIKPEVEELFGLLPDLPFFEGLARPDYCHDGLFFDTLVHCVRNGALLQQKNIFNIRAQKKQELIHRLKDLMQDYNRNSREIHATERQLNGLISTELRAEILQNKKFEVLNDEKMTAHFVSLTKIKGEEVTISEICDDNGSEFLNVNERSSYIKNFYGMLYKKPNENILDGNSISNFLGDVAQNQVVLDAKLKDEERLALDQPLTLAELDNSINGANMKSAPGPDGITNPFIKHFWNLFRVPLLKYANHCYQNDTLSDNFRRARIRLIPKKATLNF